MRALYARLPNYLPRRANRPGEHKDTEAGAGREPNGFAPWCRAALFPPFRKLTLAQFRGTRDPKLNGDDTVRGSARGPYP